MPEFINITADPGLWGSEVKQAGEMASGKRHGNLVVAVRVTDISTVFYKSRFSGVGGIKTIWVTA